MDRKLKIPKTIEEMLKLRTKKNIIMSVGLTKDICKRIKILEKKNG